MINELYHHGVKGQRWGVRRYQNQDGSPTSFGKQRYYKGKNGDIPNPSKSSEVRKKIAGSNSKLSESSSAYRKLNDKIHDTREKNKNDRANYTDSGWKSYQENKKAIEAYKNYKDARGLSKVSKGIKAKVASAKSNRALDKNMRKVDGVESDFLKDFNTLRSKNKETTREFFDKKANMILRDLNYNDTKKGREYVMRWI